MHRKDHDPPRRLVSGDEVLERGEHAVSLTALADGIGEAGIQAAVRAQSGIARRQPLARIRLAELLGDAVRRVVEVAAAVGPADVVEDEDRHWRAGLAGGGREHLELVVDRVPVVVAVDQRRVHRRQLREHVVGDVAVEVVAAGEAALVVGGVELRHRVDHVDL